MSIDGSHIGVIMDGNGRWAKARGLSRHKGHEAGVKRLEELFVTATGRGVKYLTLFAFSTENWKRSKTEIEGLMKLFRQYITGEAQKLLKNNICVRFIGERSVFSTDLIKAMNALEVDSAENDGLQLFVGLNYGGQDEITRAVHRAQAKGQVTTQTIEENLDTAPAPMLDLVVRTSGEQRLSNFVIWQAAYAEIYFTELLWPDFDSDALNAALDWYEGRNRRFGGV